jgi:hypothetical protein
MKKTVLFLLIFLFIQGMIVFAQDCVSYMPMKPGAVWETQHFDSKNKLTSTVKSQLKDKTTNGSYIKLFIEAETFDSKGKTLGKNKYSAACDNGVFYLDMRGNMDQNGMSNFKNMQVTIDADNLDFPVNPQPGQTLKPGKFSLVAQMPSNPNGFKMTVDVYNRKVAGIESITTPAGTFDCVKMTYDMKTFMMADMITKGVEWYAKDVGLVKSETYDAKGKIIGSALLSVFK